MSGNTSAYNRLLGYYVWIERENVESPELVFYDKDEPLELPLSGKQYVVTLRNLKVYLEELQQADPTITMVVIDRLSRVGRILFRSENDTDQDA